MQVVLFQNRRDAGQKLAERLSLLKQNKPKESGRETIIIVAIPRGGVIIGDVIASKLDVKLDIVVSRKIAAPHNPEFAIGAVMPDGSYFLNRQFVNALYIPLGYVQRQASAEVKEIYRRLMSYRGSTEYDTEFKGKTVVLVDDGIATGATIIASAQWIKNKHLCKKLVIAAPVAPKEILDDLNQVADDVIVLYTPEPFIAIGRFYENFDQVATTRSKR
jgi:putative phosphoribosyl transferase